MTNLMIGLAVIVAALEASRAAFALLSSFTSCGYWDQACQVTQSAQTGRAVITAVGIGVFVAGVGAVATLAIRQRSN